MSKRALNVLIAVGAGILVLALLVPAPISGYWHTPYSDCLCDSKNLLRFEDWAMRRWSTAHGVQDEIAGSYSQINSGRYEVTYWGGSATKPEHLVVQPGWFYMKIVDGDGDVWRGTREVRPWYISEVLNHPSPATRSTVEGGTSNFE